METTGSRYHLPGAFQRPKDYNPPKPDDLAGNTYFPELNSQEYRHKAIESVENKLLPFYYTLDQNDEGQFLLSCNNFYNRVWNSNGEFCISFVINFYFVNLFCVCFLFLVFGFDSFDDIINKNENSASFNITNDSSVTTAKYVTSSMVST